MRYRVEHGDCLEIMKTMDNDSVDLVFCSPPYEDARLYGELGYKVKGQEWVDWSVARYLECVRICRGLVCWVVEGKTRNFQWTATPALLMADLHRAGVKLRKPPIYHRVGIPGSGGPDWLRNDTEWIVCSSKGRLPWSDNTACGHPPKYAPGGNMTHQTADGRVDGKKKYTPPAKSNPGNVITCEDRSDLVHCKVGGGHMGDDLASCNEAPFPEALVEVFVKSFCPPDGIVFDPFMGSGTSLAVALKNGRKARGVDIRQSQVDLTLKRIGKLECFQAKNSTSSQSDSAK